MDSKKDKIKNKYLKAKAATDKCLADLAVIRKKKTVLATSLIQKSDGNKIEKLKKMIGDL